jgi:SAM-dependent methyltransferase
MYYPDWRALTIHESSPINRGVSPKLAREARDYMPTQYLPALPRGATFNGFRNENLEQQTFADASFDLVITQDVFEHLFRPDLAIREIARTLKPGGAHVCSVPIVRKHQSSVRRASLTDDGSIVHHLEPQYHGNPVSADGALVTVDWGYDVCGYLARQSGLDVAMVVVDNIDLGIRAEYLEILVCRRSREPALTL